MSYELKEQLIKKFQKQWMTKSEMMAACSETFPEFQSYFTTDNDLVIVNKDWRNIEIFALKQIQPQLQVEFKDGEELQDMFLLLEKPNGKGETHKRKRKPIKKPVKKN